MAIYAELCHGALQSLFSLMHCCIIIDWCFGGFSAWIFFCFSLTSSRYRLRAEWHLPFLCAREKELLRSFNSFTTRRLVSSECGREKCAHQPKAQCYGASAGGPLFQENERAIERSRITQGKEGERVIGRDISLNNIDSIQARILSSFTQKIPQIRAEGRREKTWYAKDKKDRILPIEWNRKRSFRASDWIQWNGTLFWGSFLIKEANPWSKSYEELMEEWYRK